MFELRFACAPCSPTKKPKATSNQSSMSTPKRIWSRKSTPFFLSLMFVFCGAGSTKGRVLRGRTLEKAAVARVRISNSIRSLTPSTLKSKFSTNFRSEGWSPRSSKAFTPQFLHMGKLVREKPTLWRATNMKRKKARNALEKFSYKVALVEAITDSL